MGEVSPPKRQTMFDRLRRRIENYRRRQGDCIPRFDQAFNGHCEQNIQETLVLKQRFLETKAKRAAKKTDKKQDNANSLQNSLHAQQKFLKRNSDDLEPAAGSLEPPAKIQCTNQQQQRAPGQQQQQQQSSTENLTKFSVEIVQQLEFTTSTANSQPQQISTNVTVKALTNACVKSDVSSPKSNPPTPAPGRTNITCVDIGNLVECKQEPDSEFVDLEQCAAALEKDAAANGAAFPGFSDLIGDDTGDEIITSDAFKDLISEISDFHPEFMKDFDFEDKGVDGLNNIGGNCGVHHNNMKVEDDKDHHPPHPNLMDVVNKSHNNNNNSPGGMISNNQQYSPQNYDPKPRMGSYSGLDFSKAELSPAAQTLKQMAEQHQHKTQLGMNFNPTQARNVRSPYGEYQYPPGEYPGNNNSQNQTPYLNKVTNTNNNFANSPSELIKQEVMFSASQQASFSSNNGNNIELQKRMQQIQQQSVSQQQQHQNQQQPNPNMGNKNVGSNNMMGGGYQNKPFSPYGSPGPLPNHGSPQYRSQPTGAHVGQFAATPPRPPSTGGLQISQAQQMHIQQPGNQVTAGQHMQISGELKPGTSIAAHQNMSYFSQQQQQQQQQQQPQQQQQQQPGGPNESYSVSQSQTINFTQQSLRQRPGRPDANTNRAAIEQQHAKLMQHQQMLLAQRQQQQQQQQALQQQQQHLAAGMGPRPPPPEYKANPQLMHNLMGQQQQQQQQQQRFSAMRRVSQPQQPMPPSGPMMRPQQQLHGGGGNMYLNSPHMQQQQQHRMVAPQQQQQQQQQPGGNYAVPQQQPTNTAGAYGRNAQRSPNVSIGPDGLNIGARSSEWRHLLMSQQQSAAFNPGMRSSFPQPPHQGSFGMGANTNTNNPNMQQMHQQQQVIRNQPMSGSPQMLNQQMNSSQMSMNLQMSQSMSVSGGANPQGAYSNAPMSGAPPTGTSSTPDFSLEFLEHLPTGDSSHFSAAAQELLNSLDSGSAFNLQDIL